MSSVLLDRDLFSSLKSEKDEHAITLLSSVKNVVFGRAWETTMDVAAMDHSVQGKEANGHLNLHHYMEDQLTI